MRRVLLSVAIILATLRLAVPAEPWYIVPGSSLGPLRIGMPFEEARTQAVATFKSVHDFTGKRILMRNPETGAEVIAEFDVGGLLDELATTWPEPRTGLGLGVGSSRLEVTKELGQPSRVFGERQIAYYDKLGLAFRYAPDLKVDLVYVLRPGATIHWDR